MIVNDTHVPEIEDGDAKEDRHFVTALARGLEVLACFKRGETFLANHDIAERCRLPRSTVSRLTYTLTKLGYLHFVEEVGKYRLGTQLVALSTVALGGLDVRQIARTAMRDLANFSSATVGLAVRDRLSMRYVECLRGPAAISLNIDVGVRMSMVRSSIGRAYIAALTEAERAPLFEELRMLDPLAWPKVRANLDKAMEDQATLGCCCSFGDWQENVSAIAVGFRPGGGVPPMAINCGAPTVITSPEFLLEQVRPRLIEMVRRLDGVMGA
ncbi:MAG: IclR family transcriptional regulator [Azorhizobium sp. 35-67-5]|nr:MAG: IclR family transcriptional regulator [Rhizobiales bacterium 12-68-15]OYX86320.1 MAG: IclR family transcriptional regulator [Azorhizobium sp. 35-67-5]OYX88697.1 MAG: IclR family transcriptional regulator [Azorhizobium sp. 32-67-21]